MGISLYFTVVPRFASYCFSMCVKTTDYAYICCPNVCIKLGPRAPPLGGVYFDAL